MQSQGWGSLEGLLPPPYPQASFQDDESSELTNRLDIILYINSGIG